MHEEKTQFLEKKFINFKSWKIILSQDDIINVIKPYELLGTLGFIYMALNDSYVPLISILPAFLAALQRSPRVCSGMTPSVA